MNEGRRKRFKVSEVADFCAENDSRGICFGGWPKDILEIYINWHHQNGGLFVVEMDERVVGVGIAWRCCEHDLDRHWTAWNDEGDCFYISDVVCSERRAIGTLVDGLSERFSGWRSLRLLAKRRGKIREFCPRFLDRLGKCGKDEKAVS